jgi:hypothetical protein
MCFSATASFALSSVLTGIGALSLARNSSPSHRMLAGIPLIFAVQQAAEGVVWLTLTGTHPTLNRVAVDVFLAVALVVWPVWSPLALKQAELNPSRRRALGVMVWVGGAVALATSILLFGFPPVPRVAGHSIRYVYGTVDDASSHIAYLFAYAVATVVPFFVSSIALARSLGALLILSLLASAAIQRSALTSVWCFFAAVLSVLIVVALDREQRALSFGRPAAGV